MRPLLLPSCPESGDAKTDNDDEEGDEVVFDVAVPE